MGQSNYGEVSIMMNRQVLWEDPQVSEMGGAIERALAKVGDRISFLDEVKINYAAFAVECVKLDQSRQMIYQELWKRIHRDNFLRDLTAAEREDLTLEILAATILCRDVYRITERDVNAI
jgi:hypothetical protein